MIDITRLYCDRDTPADSLRYGHGPSSKSSCRAEMPGAPRIERQPKTAAERRPVVAWNTSRTCNLKCVHCYTDSEAKKYENELSTEEGKALIEDLARFQIPALLFSGGEPLMRKDLFELVGHAVKLGIRPTLSTNGTLITREVAQRIKDLGFTYVGISLDGIGEINDSFRGKKGAFEKAMEGFRNCKAVEQRVGLRLTLTRHNYQDLHGIFDFIEAEGIDRACFYHLVYSGRGKESDDLTHEETRDALDIILARTKDMNDRGLEKDILTVDNHVDGIYLYMKLLEEDPERAEAVMKLLKWNGGGMYSSGVGFGDIDFLGNVHADQFWMHHSFGNVRERPFSEIWMDTSDPLMAGLKDRRSHIHGRCATCKYFDACGGALRVRADLVYGDPWAPDPACYLTDEEIG